MFILNRSLFQAHPFHMVFPSPWPALSSLSLFNITLTGVLVIQTFINTISFLLLSFICIFTTMCYWFKDIITESTYLGNHTLAVQRGLYIGLALFIISEALFFLAIFWTYFHSSISPTVELGNRWPPARLQPINPFEFPLLNTIILLSSGVSVTYAHHYIIQGNRKNYLLGLLYTILLALLFTVLQGTEYYSSPFTISDGVFGSCFFFGTGFHGFHVIIGTIFLLFSLGLGFFYHLSSTHHLGLEFSIMYWHFVDIVWLILYIVVYFWSY